MGKIIDEPRYAGTNWDEVKVAENRGANGTTARKVLTKGICQMEAGELIARVVAKLRQGYEVRLTDGNGNDAIRVYPCVAKGSDHMESTARTMNQLKASLNDKTVRLVKPDGLAGNRERGTGNRGEGADEGDGVTPDIMVTCEVCGHRQRVGKRRAS